MPKTPVPIEDLVIRHLDGILSRQVARVEYQLRESEIEPIALEFAKLELALLERLFAKLL